MTEICCWATTTSLMMISGNGVQFEKKKKKVSKHLVSKLYLLNEIVFISSSWENNLFRDYKEQTVPSIFFSSNDSYSATLQSIIIKVCFFGLMLKCSFSWCIMCKYLFTFFFQLVSQWGGQRLLDRCQQCASTVFYFFYDYSFTVCYFPYLSFACVMLIFIFHPSPSSTAIQLLL